MSSRGVCVKWFLSFVERALMCLAESWSQEYYVVAEHIDPSRQVSRSISDGNDGTMTSESTILETELQDALTRIQSVEARRSHFYARNWTM